MILASLFESIISFDIFFPISQQSWEPKRQPCGLEDILGGFGRIAVRADVFESAPAQELVPVDVFVYVKDRLPGDEEILRGSVRSAQHLRRSV